MKYYFYATSAIWCLVLFTWPMTWSLHHFSDSYTGDSTAFFLLLEYFTWSAYLYPLYAGIAIYGGYRLLARQASPLMIVLLSMLPFLSAAPYIGLSLLSSFIA